MSCDDGHCVTCSDEGVAMTILAVGADGVARCIDDDGSAVEVMTDLVAGVRKHDRVLVHAGVALARVAESPEDFRR
jgi:hydrogenase maturation factor